MCICVTTGLKVEGEGPEMNDPFIYREPECAVCVCSAKFWHAVRLLKFLAQVHTTRGIKVCVNLCGPTAVGADGRVWGR